MNLRKKPTPQQKLVLLKEENKHLDNLTDVYPLELSEKLLKNKEKLNAIARTFDNATSAVSKAVMFMCCNSSKCPHANVCVLNKNEIAPDGYPCPIEMKISMELESSLINELEIDPQSTIEMELLYDLIDAKLLDMRSSGILSKEGLVQIITVNTGKSITTSKDVAPEFKIKMDLKKLKYSIMTDFVATRKAKKRYGIGTSQGGLEDIINDAIKRKTE
jgi:hypothetical protein